MSSFVTSVVGSAFGPIMDGKAPSTASGIPAGERLIDRDNNKFFLLKHLLVICEPGVCTDGMYDFLPLSRNL
jgi:hypothetical protein